MKWIGIALAGTITAYSYIIRGLEPLHADEAVYTILAAACLYTALTWTLLLLGVTSINRVTGEIGVRKTGVFDVVIIYMALNWESAYNPLPIFLHGRAVFFQLTNLLLLLMFWSVFKSWNWERFFAENRERKFADYDRSGGMILTLVIFTLPLVGSVKRTV